MTEKMRFEGLTLTVASVEKAIELYSGKLGLKPHDEPWERSMTAMDPDGYAVEFAQGKRGKNQTKS